MEGKASVKPYYDHKGVTIYHDDCQDVLPTLMPVNLLLTDPPYGVNLGDHKDMRKRGFLIKEKCYDDSPSNFTNVVVPCIARSLSLSCRGMVFCVPPSMWELPAPNTIGGVFISSAVGRNKWGFSNLIHLLLYGIAPELNKGAKNTAIYNNSTSEMVGHPVTKPLGWLLWSVALGSLVNDTILDPFMGSGTTLVAAKQLGRKAIGIEIEEKYCEIAAERLAQEVLPL